MVLYPILFDDALLQKFGKVGAHDRSDMFGCDLLHIVLHHDLDELFESGLCRIPAQFALEGSPQRFTTSVGR